MKKSMKLSLYKNAEFEIFVLWASSGSPPTAHVYILWYKPCRKIKKTAQRKDIEVKSPYILSVHWKNLYEAAMVFDFHGEIFFLSKEK